MLYKVQRKMQMLARTSCTSSSLVLIVVAAALATFKMKSVNDHPADDILPDADTVWTLSISERREILMDLCGKVYDRFVSFKFNSPEMTPAESDNVYEYSLQLLRLGCFYFEYADAIKEGDGGHVFRCWKYMIPIFSASHNTSYACEAAYLHIASKTRITIAMEPLRKYTRPAGEEYPSGFTHGASKQNCEGCNSFPWFKQN